MYRIIINFYINYPILIFDYFSIGVIVHTRYFNGPVFRIFHFPRDPLKHKKSHRKLCKKKITKIVKIMWHNLCRTIIARIYTNMYSCC